MSSGRETHFTPKGVSIGGSPLAINMRPLRGWKQPRVETTLGSISERLQRKSLDTHFHANHP